MGKTKRGGSVAAKNALKKLKIEELSSETAGVEEPKPSTSFSAVEDAKVKVEASVDPAGDEEPALVVNPHSRLFKDEHPMLNPMLLMKVISYYEPDLEDFKILRQVCKCWYDVTFDLWRSKFILRLTEETEVFRMKPKGGISVGEFLKRFEDPDDPYQLAIQPYTKYAFTELTIDMNICDKEGSECKRFWDGVGPLMEYLHFNRCFFPTGQYMAFEQLLLEKLPNLKALEITDTGKVTLPSLSSESPYAQRQKAVERMRTMKERLLDDHQNLKSLRIYGGIPVKLRRLIGRLPYLEDLQIRNSVHTSATYDDSILDLLVFLRKQRIQSNYTKYSLKTLDLMHTKVFYSWFSISRLLNQVRFPLHTLSVEVKPDQSLNHQALKPLLEHHLGTLKTLKVFCPPLSNTNFHDTFPFDINLESLESLHLWGNVVRSFKFLRFMPNLKRLIINRYCIEKWEEVIMQQKEISQFGWFHPNHRTYILPFSDDMVQRTVQECDMSMVVASSLEVLRIDYDFNEVSLRTMKDWMPNLKTLSAVVTNKSLSVLCELWPDLRHLRVMSQSDLDDEAITGWKFDGDEPKERIAGACLADLKDLRKFQLDALCSKSKLTDKTADYGLLKLERLEAIHICVSSKFTTEAEEKLKKHIPVVRVVRNYGRKPHGDGDEGHRVGVCCFHKKFFETLRSDEEAHRQRQGALERARERRLARQNVADARAELLSSSDSDSSDSSSDSDDELPPPRLRRFGGNYE